MRERSVRSKRKCTTSRKAWRTGFTLVELMVVVAVIAILASVAVPNYADYVRRSRLSGAFETLATTQTRLESVYQDLSRYGTGTCAVPTPLSTDYFTYACTLQAAGQGFTLTATGVGAMTGYSFSVDDRGVRRTLAHPRGLPGQNCWTIRGGSCV